MSSRHRKRNNVILALLSLAAALGVVLASAAASVP
jgi:hypothetical protein